jgi:copper(I)-binding protein
MTFSRIVMTICAASLFTSCASSEPIAVEDAWARVSPAGVTSGAAYFKITATDDDALIGVTVSDEIADHAEIHEVVHSMDMSDESTSMHDDEMHDGAMSMQEMEFLPLSGGSPVRLAPGGYHIMLIDLVEPLTVGMTFDLTLDFETADDLTVSVEVSEG